MKPSLSHLVPATKALRSGRIARRCLGCQLDSEGSGAVLRRLHGHRSNGAGSDGLGEKKWHRNDFWWCFVFYGTWTHWNDTCICMSFADILDMVVLIFCGQSPMFLNLQANKTSPCIKLWAWNPMPCFSGHTGVDKDVWPGLLGCWESIILFNSMRNCRICIYIYINCQILSWYTYIPYIQ